MKSHETRGAEMTTGKMQYRMPMIPGLTSTDQWHRRATTPGGFKKNQVLAQEWTIASPSPSRPGMPPRALKLRGASVSQQQFAQASAFEGPCSPPLTGRSLQSWGGVPTPRPGRTLVQAPTTYEAIGQQKSVGFADEVAAPLSPATEAGDAFKGDGPIERPGVLRFAAYLAESTNWQYSGELGEPAHGGVSVRKCIVLYHLEDCTVEVLEERTENSGLAGGRFFARAPPANATDGVWRPVPRETRSPEPAVEEEEEDVAAPMGSPTPYGPEGLEVGGRLEFLGQTFYLIDADPFTRDFYANVLGKPQGAPIPYPAELPDEYRAEHATCLGTPAFRSRTLEIKRTTPGREKRRTQMEKEKAFYESDGRDLVFRAVWSDDSPGGEDRLLTVRYHLASKLVDMTLDKTKETTASRIFANRRLLLNFKESQGAADPSTRQPPKYAEPQHLIVGATLDVYNRNIQLLDATDYTRRWYAHTLGVDQPPKVSHPGCTEKHASEEENTRRSAAAQDADAGGAEHTFFGFSEHVDADRRAAMAKKLRLEGKLVRCRLVQKHQFAPSDGPIPAAYFPPREDKAADDVARTFVATFFLADDTLTIFQEHVPNSGVLGGPFLKRGRYKHLPAGEEKSRDVAPRDLRLGAKLALTSSTVFDITEFDPASLKVMAELKDIFPFADPDAVLETLRSSADCASLCAALEPSFPPAQPSDQPPQDTISAQTLAALLPDGLLDAHQCLTLVTAYPSAALLARALQPAADQPPDGPPAEPAADEASPAAELQDQVDPGLPQP